MLDAPTLNTLNAPPLRPYPEEETMGGPVFREVAPNVWFVHDAPQPNSPVVQRFEEALNRGGRSMRDFTPRHKLEQALQDIRDQALENDEPWYAARVDEVLARKTR